jgi:predicted 3-demethylubiquinone-9 3-methyltransferase (glyoxalase superfamily)
MQRIVPHLWFDKEAKEAAAFYASVFPNSRVTHTVTITGTPSGDCDLVSFEVRGQPFKAINAGPLFRINPSVSFIVNYDPSQENTPRESLDAAWSRLSEGGTTLMPIDKYPWSERYGWIQDRFGVSWQLILTNPKGEERPQVVPSLLFTQEVCGKAEEAIEHYLSVFENSKLGAMMRYGPGQQPDREGTLMFADFRLLDLWCAAMDSARQHGFGFNEAVSFMVWCDSQREIDYYWKRLSAHPESEQCGWLKDKYGLSWQILPSRLEEMMRSGDRAAIERITRAFLGMKKFDLERLEVAFAGRTAKPTKPRRSVKPAKAKSAKSRRPVKRAKAAKPAKSGRSVKRAKAAKPAKSRRPVKRAKAVKARKASRKSGAARRTRPRKAKTRKTVRAKRRRR